jgi:hypothetical protein
MPYARICIHWFWIHTTKSVFTFFISNNKSTYIYIYIYILTRIAPVPNSVLPQEKALQRVSISVMTVSISYILHAFGWFIEIYQWNINWYFHCLRQWKYQFDIFTVFNFSPLRCFSELPACTVLETNDVTLLMSSRCIIIWHAFH